MTIGSELDKQIYPEGENTWGLKEGFLDVEDVKNSIKNIIDGLINDWEICKKANVEPYIHPRRVMEMIKREVGMKLIDYTNSAKREPTIKENMKQEIDKGYGASSKEKVSK